MCRLSFIILLFFVSFSNIYGQDISDFVSGYGLEKMSKKGQLILAKHNMVPNNLFELDNGSVNRKSFRTIKNLFRERFQDSLNEKDLNIILNYWEGRYSLDYYQIKEKVNDYKVSIECQKKLIDSIQEVYNPIFENYDSILFNFYDKNIFFFNEILKNYEKLIISDSIEYVEIEKELTLSIDSSMFKYMNQAFQILKVIPRSWGIGSYAGKFSKISFPDSLVLNEYFEVYRKFEDEFITRIKKSDCKSHWFIPNYNRDENDNKRNKLTKICAVLYFLLKNKNVNQEAVKKSNNLKFNSLNFIVQNSNYKIEDLIDQNALIRDSFIKDFSFHPNSLSFVKVLSKTDAIIFHYTQTDSIMKCNIIKEINDDTRVKLQKLTLEKDIEVFYNLEKEFDFDSNEENITIVSFCIIDKELIIIGIGGKLASEKSIAEALKYLIKIKE